MKKLLKWRLWTKRKSDTFDPKQSNSYQHAEREMKLLFGDDYSGDFYKGLLPESVLRLMEVFAQEGHSGMSAGMAITLFSQLADFKALTPLTNNPAEWNHVSDNMWQNIRQSSSFSNDAGLTYYNLDDRNEVGEYNIYTSEAAK
jgi:hypothetical protein